MNNSPFQPGARLAAYLRDSGGEEQELSVEQQLSVVTAWCADRSFILAAIYTDAAKPGSSTIGRDQFQLMLSYFRSHDCDLAGIIVWKYSRFARDIDDAQFYRADLRRRGYEIYSLNDSVPSGIDGRFFEAAIDWMNQRFLDDLSADVKRGLHHIVTRYHAVPGTPPVGFLRTPIQIGARRDGRPHIAHKWEPDPEYTAKIRTAFELRANGAPYSVISAETNLYPSKNSYPTFFNNPIYKGELHFGSLIIPDYCAPIVSPDLWQRAQRGRQRLKSGDNPRHPRRTGTFLLTGLLHCARCGSAMNGHIVRSRSGSTWHYYACSRKINRRDCDAPYIPMNPLDQYIKNDIKAVIYSPENVRNLQITYLKMQEEALKVNEPKIEENRRKLISIRRQIANTTGAIAELGSSHSLLEKLQSLEIEEARLLSSIADLDRKTQPSPFLSLSPDELSAAVTEAIDAGNQEEMHQLLASIIHRITLERSKKIITGIIDYYALKKAEAPIRGLPYAYILTPLGGTTHRHYFTFAAAPASSGNAVELP